MALESLVFPQNPFKDLYCNGTDGSGVYSYSYGYGASDKKIIDQQFSSSSPDTVSNKDLLVAVAQKQLPAAPSPPASLVPSGDGAGGKRKRRRLRSFKNKQELENQRMTHIAVERNRRKQMNEYLAVLRSLMPPSYSQRGDQATIVGGAINFVKELEHLVQLLDASIQVNHHQYSKGNRPGRSTDPLSNYLTFPQYSTQATSRAGGSDVPSDMMSEGKRSNVADIEVAMVESHANIKIILSTRRPKLQLLKMITLLQSICVTILHLSVTTVGHSVLYSLTVKVEDECEVSRANEIASAVHEIVSSSIQEKLPIL